MAQQRDTTPGPRRSPCPPAHGLRPHPPARRVTDDGVPDGPGPHPPDAGATSARARGSSEAQRPGDGGRRTRVYCVPHAGGSADAYQGWRATSASLDAGLEFVPVELPGRGRRWPEPPATHLGEWADSVLGLVAQRPESEPFVLLGHSMGGHVAWEAARRLEQEGRTPPRLLVVSGCPPADVTGVGPDPALSDEALLDRVRLLGGMPPELLRHRGLTRMWLSVLRADLRLLDRFLRHTGPTKLGCRVLSLGGTRDPLATPALTAAWREHAAAEFHHQVFPGDHFFLHRHRSAVTGLIAELVVGRTGAPHAPAGSAGDQPGTEP